MTPRQLTAVLTLGLAASLASAVLADTLRTPLTHRPALEISTPSGWTPSRQDSRDGGLAVASPDRSGFVTLSVIGGDGLIPPLQELAGNLASGGAARLLAGSRSAAIDGHPGKAFDAILPATGRAATDIRYVIVILDRYHVAVVSTLVAANATPAQRQLIARLADSVRVRIGDD